MSLFFKRTKILATVGPAVNDQAHIEQMIDAGTNGFRLNFSHEQYDAADRHIAWIRAASQKAGKPVAILQDLQGPKIRLGEITNNHFEVTAGDELVLDFAAEHAGTTIPVQYNLADKVKPGEALYIFDGKIRTIVKTIESATAVRVVVENDGVLMSRKGLNLPDTDFGGDIITEKDLRDLRFGFDKDIDFVALSFVQSPDDINQIRQLLAEGGSKAQVVAKIETKAAIADNTLEAIVKASDGVMVARGDLAVEVGAEKVPVLQRRIIALCRQYNKLSIVATQMLGSMTHAPEPTRAEVSDVATAVILGADTVMLSDETANGDYPIEAIQSMKKVILYTQEHAATSPLSDVMRPRSRTPQTAICTAAIKLASELEADVIVAETKSGVTAATIAAHRPLLPIISVTSQPQVAQQLALNYANKSFVRPDGEKAGLSLIKELREKSFFQKDGPLRVVVVSGRQPGLTGGTDTLRVRVLD